MRRSGSEYADWELDWPGLVWTSSEVKSGRVSQSRSNLCLTKWVIRVVRGRPADTEAIDRQAYSLIRPPGLASKPTQFKTWSQPRRLLRLGAGTLCGDA